MQSCKIKLGEKEYPGFLLRKGGKNSRVKIEGVAKGDLPESEQKAFDEKTNTFKTDNTNITDVVEVQKPEPAAKPEKASRKKKKEEPEDAGDGVEPMKEE